MATQPDAIAIRLLVVNPNTTDAVTERLGRTAISAAAPGTRVEAVAAPSGIAVIETLEQSRLAGDAVVRLLVRRAGDFDAAIIAAYSDPGLREARACVSQPVVGIAEASILEATALGGRFVVLMPGGPLIDYVRQLAIDAGAARQLAAVREFDAPLSMVAADPMRFLEPLRQALCRAVEDDRADAIIVGGGPLAGIAERLASEFHVTLLDGVTCAVRRAERLVRARRAPTSGPEANGPSVNSTDGRSRM